MSTASLSLDLDNAWSYLKTRGDESWRDYPSYLDLVVPIALDLFDELDQPITFFVVGIDADTLDERHWKRLSIGTLIRAMDQAYILMPPFPGWRMSCFFASDGQRVTGRTTYRRPASLRAWLSIALPLARKLWKRWTKKTPSP